MLFVSLALCVCVYLSLPLPLSLSLCLSLSLSLCLSLPLLLSLCLSLSLSPYVRLCTCMHSKKCEYGSGVLNVFAFINQSHAGGDINMHTVPERSSNPEVIWCPCVFRVHVYVHVCV